MVTQAGYKVFCFLGGCAGFPVSAEHVREIGEHIQGIVRTAFHSGRLYFFGDAQVGVGVQCLKINAEHKVSELQLGGLRSVLRLRFCFGKGGIQSDIVRFRIDAAEGKAFIRFFDT